MSIEKENPFEMMRRAVDAGEGEIKNTRKYDMEAQGKKPDDKSGGWIDSHEGKQEKYADQFEGKFGPDAKK
ncbi:MAG: hypothetical protein A3G52_00365 [Candidatus Taylorbacteria bacterium RIFCSPLOWO2_12_FULL_43_20]|uniref:Uncharacterized protein n=1 Tax=Candidatus Taylorbacteria bacterium RIFCSPLOWO2_12_FULL_43_20 TaxID=1802332 RepID=A0A1G2P1N6_9BACT|nr:MAG: hypothetical protein A2825_01760 [Candidatus Taylorbacteria bacterium RIFCSPHIGHO2_01_FULL_43_120]OHA23083.1 MAG: hypothetical protein A3B98_03445 [Candidatus Taylorbacteria bacterium RIFCSPHIGHO2_02_FULL_43_55]OHA28936.1 MAG: hypothetical protein A3E92_04685 [Candidatus Taylorbacteria bacterium RIFCSPHIGHO2_12_FULL_42_34]OHA37763.1 MAG: hypothetical protein A3H58_01265 [Candidatus Taylorbacteria bacterium RIFCSPLOWO2_02_FULL_43_22b]OHA42193.1 MAG: hypothetical protein A3G52_00365 [Cand